MNLKKRPHAAFACGIALAISGFSAHAVEPEASAAPSTTNAADTPAVPSQTRLLFSRGFYRPGIERLRVVRRDGTITNIVGQVALSVAVSMLTGTTTVGAQGFTKDNLAGDTLEELKDDPLGVNPAISDLNDALS